MNPMALCAKDIMRTEVIKAYAGMSLKDLAQLFETEHITGVPVVEGKDKLIGVISETDLVRFEAHRSHVGEEAHSYIKEEAIEGDGKESPYLLNDPEEKTVEDIMTPWSISTYEDTPIAEVAKTMIKQRIHRVFVTDRNLKLKGIITTMDIVRVMAEFSERKIS